MNLVADLHCHTISSGHAYSTVKEMVQSASDHKLETIAITDHGPMMPGGPHLYHFGNIKVVPRELYGVAILRGVEANIIDYEGNLDMPDQYLNQLDIVLAGFHRFCYPGGNVEDNTKAMINAMKQPYVDIIVHPGNPEYPIDIEKVVVAAKELNVFIEINNSSFSVSRRGSEVNCCEIAKMVKRYNSMVSIGSDAHIYTDVGNFTKAREVIAQAGLEKDNILNTSSQALKTYLSRKQPGMEPKEKVFPVSNLLSNCGFGGRNS